MMDPRPEPSPPTHADPQRATVSLRRGGHLWVVRCGPGDEPVLRRTLSAWAGRADFPFGAGEEALMLRRFHDRLEPGLHKPHSSH